MISIVFFGTNKFAATILEAIVKSGLFDIQAIVTQPDRPVGRHQEMQKSAVKTLGEKYNLKIEQPESLKGYTLQTADHTLNIVVEYGLIIPQVIIDASKMGSINIHPSLLPKYRGPSPIQSVLMNGETETAVSIMMMDKKMDHGPILAQENVAISADDDFVTLSDKLATLSAKMITETVLKYLDGSITPIAQDDSMATFCKILNREDGKVDFAMSSKDIYNIFRGLLVWPGIFCFYGEKRLKLHGIIPSEQNISAGKVHVENGRIFVGCQSGSLEILSLQIEGKKVMTAKEFLNGYTDFDGKILN